MKVPNPPKEHLLKKYSKYLSTDEKIVTIHGVSGRYVIIKLLFYLSPLLGVFASYIVSSLILKLALLVVPMIIILIETPAISTLVRKRQSLKYILTNRRLLIIKGILARKLTTAPLDRITHVTIEQSALERFIYNSGQMLVITAGFDQREIVIENIASPVEFKVLMEELMIKLDTDPGLKNESEEEELKNKESKKEVLDQDTDIRPIKFT
ncbi:MAG TPA: PH domain-containing protein [Patescibacteria group bacterium]